MAVNSFNAQNPPVTTKGDVFTFSTIPTRLGVGANNTVLTADSSTATGLKWATPAAGGMTQLATGTLSGAQVNLTGISGSYKDLRLIIRNYDPSGDADSLRLFVNNDQTSRYFNTTTAAADNVTFNRSDIQSPSQDNGTSSAFIDFLISDYANTSTWKVGTVFFVFQNSTTPANINHQWNWWGYNQTGAITQINIQAQNTFSGGTYILYGVS